METWMIKELEKQQQEQYEQQREYAYVELERPENNPSEENNRGTTEVKSYSVC